MSAILNAKIIATHKENLLAAVFDFSKMLTSRGDNTVNFDQKMIEATEAYLRSDLFEFQDYTKTKDLLFRHRVVPIMINYPSNITGAEMTFGFNVFVLCAETDDLNFDIDQKELFNFAKQRSQLRSLLIFTDQQRVFTGEPAKKTKAFVGIFVSIDVLKTLENIDQASITKII